MMKVLHARRRSRRNSWLLFGCCCTDVVVSAEEVELNAGSVWFRSAGVLHETAYTGPAIGWGDKRVASADLSPLAQLPGAAIVPGGGAWNTGVRLSESFRRLAAAPDLAVVNAAAGSPDDRAFQEHQIRHMRLGIEAPPVNLVLTRAGGMANRLILKSPSAPGSLPFGRRRELVRELGREARVVLINSVRSRDLAALAVGIARQARALQFSVLTESLASEDRISLLLAHDCGSVCNLREFAGLAAALGVMECPEDETSAPVEQVADALARVSRRVRCGDLVVTLGARGSMVLDRRSRTVFHVCLWPGIGRELQERLQTHPERVNGAGDRFFGSFVVHRVRGSCHRLVAPAADAVRRAALDVVRDLCPGMALGPRDFAIRSILEIPRPGTSRQGATAAMRPVSTPVGLS